MDNQAKWRKLGYRGADSTATMQALKKTTNVIDTSTTASSNDVNATKRMSEIRQTGDSDISSGRTVAEKNSAGTLSTRQPEPNGVRKDLMNPEKRRRLSLVDEKDLHLLGNEVLYFYGFIF